MVQIRSTVTASLAALSLAVNHVNSFAGHLPFVAIGGPSSSSSSPPQKKHVPPHQTLNLVVLFSQTENENGSDDWYSDYTPQSYNNRPPERTSYSTSNDNNSNRSRGGGGGGGDRYGSNDRYGGRDNTRGRFSGGGDRNRNSGGGGRGGGYERDTSTDNSNVDVAAVERLIGDRTAARRANDFDAADEIRAELLNAHGVQVWDKERVWKTGCSVGGSGGGNRRFGNNDNNSRDSSRGGRGRDGPAAGRRPRPPKDFGPTGHDYAMAPDAGPIVSDLSEREIDELIAARLQAKMSRNFEQADQLQSELTNAGVFVHDGSKEWRADGVMFGDYANGDRPGRERGSRNSERNQPFEQSTYSTGLNSLSEEQISDINALVSRRAGAKLSRNYKTADKIRDELKDDFNVFVDDRLKQWSVGGDFGPDSPGNLDKNRPWSMSTFSEPLAHETQLDEIMAELEKRNEAKVARDFDKADSIRESLLNELNVALDDRLREWSIGGDFGLKPKRGEGPFVRRGGGELSVEEEAEIADLVDVRARAKKNRDFQTSDELRDLLESKYSVKVDDQSKLSIFPVAIAGTKDTCNFYLLTDFLFLLLGREWRVMSDDYVMTRNNFRTESQLDEESIGYIQKRLRERLAFKSERLYDAADDIRDELKSKYSVSIDDRTREWSIEVDQFTVVNNGNSRSNEPPPRPDYFVVEDDVMDDNVNGEEETEGAGSLESFTVPELKEKLKAAGLPVSGRKAELIERLTSGKVSNS